MEEVIKSDRCIDWNDKMKTNQAKKRDKKASTVGILAGRFRRLLIAAVLVVAVSVFLFSGLMPDGSGDSASGAMLYEVQRGDLTVSVTESGDIKAMNSQDIKSEVEGRTTIISIVDEGTYITQQDVENGRILVELDSSDIKEKLDQHEIKFLSTQASYTDANESLDIQKKENESNIRAGLMEVRFTLIDLKKYLGESIAGSLVAGSANLLGDEDKISMLVDEPALGGEALQKLRQLQNDIKLAEMRFTRAENKLEGTLKLYDANYVAETELEGDKLEKQSNEIQVEKAHTSLELFKRYEFSKQAEKLLSDYNEAELELERIKARARSKLAKAQAKLASEKATYFLQEERLAKLRKQLDACIVRAPSPGQVVYSSSTDAWARRNRPIEIGAEIRERQKIISIPDMSEMEVEIKVHENWIDKIQPGQKAEISVAAFPDSIFTGEVLSKAPLAEPERWFNSDHKAYVTDVRVDGTHDFLKTGMTAKVMVIIDHVENVIRVPIQSVISSQQKKFCYVMTGQGRKLREVMTGQFNDDFVEIKSGLSETEKILLNPPRVVEADISAQ